jgi:hypothetical protein
MLKQVKEYMDKNHKRPSDYNKDKEIKQMGSWIVHQQNNYKKKEYIMKEKEIYDEWTKFIEEYNKYFMDNNEIWYNMLDKVKEYINTNHKRPSCHDTDKEIKQMGKWIVYQQNNYKKKEQIMKEKEIYDEWTKFIEEYKEYFLDNNVLWYNMLKQVKEYMDKNHKRPSDYNKYKEIKQMGSWIQNQQKNYKKKDRIMKEKEIYDEWTKFIEEYEEYFMDNNELWYNMLDKVKEYIDKNHKRPSDYNKDKEIKQMGSWIQNQQNNYKKKEYIMKEKEIYDEWTKFIEEYNKYFMDNNEIWYNMLDKVKEYINTNHKRPSSVSRDKKNKQMGQWIVHQQNNYKKKDRIMKEKEIYDEWTKFIEEYKEYFLDNNVLWYNMLKQVKEYIDKNHKRPSDYNKDKEIKQMGQWIGNQQKNYKKKEYIMKEKEIYDEWSKFIEEYNEYL